MMIELEWKQLTKSLVVWIILFTLIILGFSAIYPQMHTTAFAQLVNGKVDSLSPTLLKTCNIEGSGIASFTNSLGFFCVLFSIFISSCLLFCINQQYSRIDQGRN